MLSDGALSLPVGWDDVIERLTQLCAEKKRTAPSIAEARRELGQQTIAEYAKQRRPRQRRMTEYSTGRHVDSSVNVHVVPRLGSRKLNSVTPIVVERFLDELEADGGGRSRKSGARADGPVKGVQEPEYVRGKVVIPSLAYVKKVLAAADEDLALEVVMMVGCGLRNGEARVVNVNNVVSDDVYRVHEQIHSNTHRPATLKHRKAGEFREVPLPCSAREMMERYHGADGTPPCAEALQGPPGGGRCRHVQLPALLRLERAWERDSDHRRGGMDGPQVHRGDVSHLPAPDAGQHHQGRPTGPAMVRTLVSIGLRNVLLLGGAFSDQRCDRQCGELDSAGGLPRLPSAAAGFRRPGGDSGQAVEAVGRLVGFGGH